MEASQQTIPILYIYKLEQDHSNGVSIVDLL
jgi:hypothetical protein